MKGTRTQVKQSPKSNNSSDIDMDCTCEILLDDSLSDVGDSDCDCSDCLQANLHAYNEFSKENEDTVNTITQQNNLLSRRNKRHGSTAKEISNGSKTQQQNMKRNQSSDRFHASKNTKGKLGTNQNQENSGEGFEEFEEGPEYSNGQINDFLILTKYRTRKYLEERRKLEENQKEQRQQLKDKIKKNLEILKYTSEILLEGKEPKENKQEGNQGRLKHEYKWNHSKYRCQCNGKHNQKHTTEECCRKQCQKIKKHESIDTNLANLNQEFKQNKQAFLQQVQKQRIQKQQEQKNQKCQDKCPNHHNRTDKERIKQIETMIIKNVEKLRKKQKKEKQEQKKKQKNLENKLNALDAKCKEIVKKSKVYDPSISRSSFRLSIDNYDTFSDLREEEERRKFMKKSNMEAKMKLKKGDAELLEKIYEEDDDQIFDKIMKTPPPPPIVTTKEKYIRPGDEVYKKIAYEAKIMSPRNLKGKKQQEKKSVEKQKEKQRKKIQAEKEKKKAEALNKQKEQKERRRVNEEVERKKKQIMKQFQKRNSNMPQNTEIRKQYEQKLKQPAVQEHKQTRKQQTSKDPYRSNYRTQAAQNSDQIRTHGDPLLQEYVYHQDKEREQLATGKNMDIFMTNVEGLTSKKKLLP